MVQHAEAFEVDSPEVTYSDDYITSRYRYQTTQVEKREGKTVAVPKSVDYELRTARRVPRTGLMLVGWGGNNGSTTSAVVLANKLQLSWRTKAGVQHADYVGSMTQSSTVRLGGTGAGHEDVYVPFSSLLPMVHPNDLVLGGWDVNQANLADACERAQVLDANLQQQLRPHLEQMLPLPAPYYADFVASNQGSRADNVLPGSDKQRHLDTIREQIRAFKKEKGCDKVIILWTATTERFAAEREGVHDRAQHLLAAIERSEAEVSPSALFAVAAVLEGCTFINGSPQNTLLPAVRELAEQRGVMLGGDDFKSGQTKMKSVIVDFLLQAGIKPTSIVSYNHLGNNDGRNLSEPATFQTKEASKSNVVDDMVGSNRLLYKEGESPDHVVVIKYVPFVGDSKRAMDEYSSQICMGGINTIVMHNTCEDSLLAAPLLLDLALLAELISRIEYKREGSAAWGSFHPIMSILSYLLKAPLTPPGTPVVNALFKQRACIENIFRACVGLPPENHMLLEHKRGLVELAAAAAASFAVPKQNVNGITNGKAPNGHSANGQAANGNGSCSLKRKLEGADVGGVSNGVSANGRGSCRANGSANGSANGNGYH